MEQNDMIFANNNPNATPTPISTGLNNLEKTKRTSLLQKRDDLLSMDDRVLKVIFNIQNFAEQRVDTGTLNEGEYMELSNELAEQYKELKKVIQTQQNTIKTMFDILGNIRQTDWYKKNTDQPYNARPCLTEEQKLANDDYEPCRFCDSLIKKGLARNGVRNMDKHHKTAKCQTIQLGREQSVFHRRPTEHARAIVIGRQLEEQKKRRALLIEDAEEENEEEPILPPIE